MRGEWSAPDAWAQGFDGLRATEGTSFPHPSPLPVCTGDMVDTCSETWWTVLDLLTCRNDLQVQVDSGDTMSTPVDIVDAVLRRFPDSH
ncbi:hypothetical protein D1872_317150 [compost metagenome]